MLLDTWQKPSVATILLEAQTPLSPKERGRGVITAEGAKAIRSRNMGRKTSGAEEMSCPLHLILGMQVASVGAQLAIVHTQPASPHLQLASEQCNMAEGKSPWPTFGLPARQEALSRLLLLNGHLPAAHPLGGTDRSQLTKVHVRKRRVRRWQSSRAATEVFACGDGHRRRRRSKQNAPCLPTWRAMAADVAFREAFL